MKIKIIIAISAIMLVLAGCSDDYYSDGGLLDENIDVLEVSTMDYLKANEASFDTLVTLIELTGLEDAINASGSTFMAPQDYSITNYFELAFASLQTPPASLSEIPQEILDDIKIKLQNYLIPNEKIMREDLSSTYSYTTTYSGQRARYNLLKSDYLGNVNKGAEIINYSLNISDDDSPENYQSVHVATSNLQSTNGIIHILNADSHIFGFN